MESKMGSVLFIGCNSFDYDKIILSELKKKYIVDYVNEAVLQTKYSLYFRLIWKMHKYQKMREINDKNLMKQLYGLKAEEYDKIFAVRASNIQQCHVDYLRNRFPNAELILFMWDPINRINNWDVLKKSFDKIFSFDRKDCADYNLNYHPAFYAPGIVEPKNERKYDLCFLGTDFADRFDTICEWRQFCNNNGFRSYFKLVTSYFPFLKGVFFIDKKRRVNLGLLSIKGMSYKNFLKIISNSKVILDLTHPLQCGISSRTFEAMSLGTRLISRNKDVAQEFDLPKDKYLILEENTTHEQIIEFIKRPYEPFSIPNKFTVSAFIHDIVG